MSVERDRDDGPRGDEKLLRAFLDARDRGDEATARRSWESLVTDNFDRVANMVRLQSSGRLSRVEQQDALSGALVRLLTHLPGTFRGHTMGEWVQATKQLVAFACADVQRAETRHHQRAIAGDAPAGREDGEDSWNALTYRRSIDLDLHRQDAEDGAEEVEHGRRFLDWALPQLSQKRRAVMECDRQGVPVETIQQRLGMSADAVYQTRRRALQDLSRLRKEYSP